MWSEIRANSPWGEFLKAISKFRERKKSLSCASAEFLFCLFNLLLFFFWRSRCHRPEEVFTVGIERSLTHNLIHWLFSRYFLEKKMNLFHRNKVNSHENFSLDVLATSRYRFLDNLRLHWVTWPRWSCDRRLIDQRRRDHVASVVVDTRWCCRNVESKSFTLLLWKTKTLYTRTLISLSKCWSRLNWTGAAYLLRVCGNCWTRHVPKFYILSTT